MGGRVAEGACLENQYVRKGIEGSNPPPSATAPHGPPSWPCGRPGDGGVRAAMSIELNHTIVRCRDRQRSAGFLADILGRPAPSALGPFLVVALDNGVSLDFYAVEGEGADQQNAVLNG